MLLYCITMYSKLNSRLLTSAINTDSNLKALGVLKLKRKKLEIGKKMGCEQQFFINVCKVLLLITCAP